jgi:hypothetical protein
MADWENDPAYCAVCSTALGNLGNGLFDHLRKDDSGKPYDHAPEPVPLSTLERPRQYCDFCSAGDPSYLYEAVGELKTVHRVGQTTTIALDDYYDRHNAARVLSRRGGSRYTTNLGEVWTACVVCASYVDAKDVFGLVRHVCEQLPAKTTRGKRLLSVRGSLLAAYEPLVATFGERRVNPYGRA